jgi:hypothetical protein
LFVIYLKPISQAKYKDVQHLKQFCSVEATNYYENLPYCEKKDKGKKKTRRVVVSFSNEKNRKEAGVQARNEK